MCVLLFSVTAFYTEGGYYCPGHQDPLNDHGESDSRLVVELFYGEIFFFIEDSGD